MLMLMLVDFIHILQDYFTGTGASIWLPSASEVTLKDMGKLITWTKLPTYGITIAKQRVTKPSTMMAYTEHYQNKSINTLKWINELKNVAYQLTTVWS